MGSDGYVSWGILDGPRAMPSNLSHFESQEEWEQALAEDMEPYESRFWSVEDDIKIL